MSAFLAIASDVPRKIRTSWLFWILLTLVALALLFFWASINVKTAPDGRTIGTWFGEEFRETTEDGKFVSGSAERMVPILAGGVIGAFFACYVGVFLGLVLLSDAVTSAFAPGQAELNLPKPMSRGAIVVARHLGAVMVAAFFATLLVGGGVLVTYLKTRIWATEVLIYLPASVAVFAVLHAIGAIASVWIQNALLAVLASVGGFMISFMTNIPNWKVLGDLDKIPYPLLVKVLKMVKIAHRILPRPTDLPDVGERLLTHKFGAEPLGVSGEVELIGQTLVWWGLALVLAVLVVRRRDF